MLNLDVDTNNTFYCMLGVNKNLFLNDPLTIPKYNLNVYDPWTMEVHKIQGSWKI